MMRKHLAIRVDDEKHERLRGLAKQRGVSLNKLIDELATVALVQHDTETRFRVLAARGSKRRGIALLDKLDRAISDSSNGTCWPTARARKCGMTEGGVSACSN